MRGRRHARAIGSRRLMTVVVGTVLLLAGGQSAWLGAGDGAPESPGQLLSRSLGPTGKVPLRTVLGLGDSVPAAIGCGCRSFVVQLGQQLGELEGASVGVDNEAVSGLTTAGLLHQVQQHGSRARESQVTLITIGANDFDASQLSTRACSAPGGLACYQGALATMGSRVEAILAALVAGPGPHGPILLTGYWNVFLDGAVGAAQGPAYTRDSDALTKAVNAALQAVARRHGVRFVDLYGPFKQDRDTDETTLLAPDGDHPSARGHVLITSLLRRALLQAPAAHG